MKKKLLTLAIFASLVSTAHAEFEPIFYLNDGGVMFIDTTTIKPVPQSLTERAKNFITGRKGNRVVWQMMNTPEAGAPFKSAKTLQEVNCDTRQTDIVSMFAYSEPNGMGRVVFDVTPTKSDWQYSAPGTAGDALVNATCSDSKTTQPAKPTKPAKSNNTISI